MDFAVWCQQDPSASWDILTSLLTRKQWGKQREYRQHDSRERPAGACPAQPHCGQPSHGARACGLSHVQTALPSSRLSHRDSWEVMTNPPTLSHSLLPSSVQSKHSSVTCSKGSVFPSHSSPHHLSLSPGSGSHSRLPQGGLQTRLPRHRLSAPRRLPLQRTPTAELRGTLLQVSFTFGFGLPFPRAAQAVLSGKSMTPDSSP